MTIRGPRGAFAGLEAQPATGVCERRPALLIPGFTGSKEDFIPVLQPLASAGRRVVAVDMRGQYQSPGATSPAGYAPDELAADITAIIDALAGDGQGVHLVGHSQGGLIAREVALARTAPARKTAPGHPTAAFRRIICCGPSSPRSGTSTWARRPGPTGFPNP